MEHVNTMEHEKRVKQGRFKPRGDNYSAERLFWP